MAISDTTTRPGQAWPSHLPGLLGPAIAAVLVTTATSGRAGLADLGRRVIRIRVAARWYLVVAVTAALGAAAWGVQAMLGQGWPTTHDLSTYSGAPVMPPLALTAFVMVVNGLGEETGWRGYLVDRLAPRLGLRRTALVVAAVWAPWHLPVFWVSASLAGLGLAGTVGWLVSIIAGSVVLTWMYLGSGRSVWLVALWHTSYNMVTATAGGTGLAGPIVSAGVVAAAVAIMRRASSRAPTEPVGVPRHT